MVPLILPSSPRILRARGGSSLPSDKTAYSAEYSPRTRR